MTVWWCKKHLSGSPYRSNLCDASRLIGLEGDRPSLCSMVEMLLYLNTPRGLGPDPNEDVDESGDVEFGLVMPFVVCASEGGPYEDSAYVAGWEAGSLDIALMLSPLKEGTILRLPQAFHAGNQPQVDLIAMKHGLDAEFEDAAEGWVYLTLTSKP